MKTQDILLLGGALVVGSYFIGKGISGIKLPDINFPDINLDAPDITLPDFNFPDFNLGGLGGVVDDWLTDANPFGGFSNQSTGGWTQDAQAWFGGVTDWFGSSGGGGFRDGNKFIDKLAEAVEEKQYFTFGEGW